MGFFNTAFKNLFQFLHILLKVNYEFLFLFYVHKGFVIDSDIKKIVKCTKIGNGKKDRPRKSFQF